jgi:hypothetical protein
VSRQRPASPLTRSPCARGVQLSPAPGGQSQPHAIDNRSLHAAPAGASNRRLPKAPRPMMRRRRPRLRHRCRCGCALPRRSLLRGEQGLAQYKGRTRVPVVQVKMAKHENRVAVGSGRVKMGSKHSQSPVARTSGLPTAPIMGGASAAPQLFSASAAMRSFHAVAAGPAADAATRGIASNPSGSNP